MPELRNMSDESKTSQAAPYTQLYPRPKPNSMLSFGPFIERMSRRTATRSSETGHSEIGSPLARLVTPPADEFTNTSDLAAVADASNAELEVPVSELPTVAPVVNNEIDIDAVTVIHVGSNDKIFRENTQLLTDSSPVLCDMIEQLKARPVHQSLDKKPLVMTPSEDDSTAQASEKSLEFPQYHEFAFRLFLRYLHGAKLSGPHDFHSMNHYITLYCMGAHFQIEALRNTVMDLVRRYYRMHSMTAPPSRLEYVYENTEGPNQMRGFLALTAAYRLVVSKEAMSSSMRHVIGKGGDLSVDIASALTALGKSDTADPRKSDDCFWHDHRDTKLCRKKIQEPWQRDR